MFSKFICIVLVKKTERTRGKNRKFLSMSTQFNVLTGMQMIGENLKTNFWPKKTVCFWKS